MVEGEGVGGGVPVVHLTNGAALRVVDLLRVQQNPPAKAATPASNAGQIGIACSTQSVSTSKESPEFVLAGDEIDVAAAAGIWGG